MTSAAFRTTHRTGTIDVEVCPGGATGCAHRPDASGSYPEHLHRQFGDTLDSYDATGGLIGSADHTPLATLAAIFAQTAVAAVDAEIAPRSPLIVASLLASDVVGAVAPPLPTSTG